MATTRPARPVYWDWEHARRRCLREARRYVFAASEAEDVVQEALLRAWRHRERCSDPSSPLPWLLAITRNEALRRRQHAGRDREVQWDPDAEPSAEDGVEEVATRVDVRRALASLRHEDRRLLYLRYAEDLTQPEVARVMKMPEGTAKVRLHRLRNQLRTRLGGSP
jgi:RNA polymerase sigma-70 factor, ECF subfamily